VATNRSRENDLIETLFTVLLNLCRNQNVYINEHVHTLQLPELLLRGFLYMRYECVVCLGETSGFLGEMQPDFSSPKIHVKAEDTDCILVGVSIWSHTKFTTNTWS
jgi:hypothetical protein